MIRIVVGQSGRHFVAYRDECRLGDIERFRDGTGGSIWRWHANRAWGEEPTLGDVLDAIEGACGGHSAQPNPIGADAVRRQTRKPAGADQ